MKDYQAELEKALLIHTHRRDYILRGQTFIIQSVPDLDRILDAMCDDELNTDERLPYWAFLWPSAIALAEYILDHKDDFKRKRVLELGCGLGLTGIAAAHCGAYVLFTDYEENALTYTKKNFYMNFNKIANVKLFDWRETPIEDKFDFLIASDVIYERRFFAPLINAIDRLLFESNRVLITDPKRRLAKNFFALLDTKSYNHQVEFLQTYLDGRKYDIDLHLINKKHKISGD